jgi:sec-independent protein translocase protein TatA
MLSTSDIVLIGVIVVVLFGAPQIPKVAKSFGEGLKEFKKALKDGNEETEEENLPKKKSTKSLKKPVKKSK